MNKGLEAILSYINGELKEEYSDFFYKYHPWLGDNGYIETSLDIGRENPDLMQVDFPTISLSKLQTPLIKLSAQRNAQAPTFLVTGLIHAREFISGEVCLGIVESLIANYRNGDPLLQEGTWYFLPVVNPDGFSDNVQLVRKGKRFGSLYRGNMNGVDLNRNFADNFEQRSWTTKQRFSPEYAGVKAFSELETKFLKNLVEEIQPTAVINLHSFSNAILYPPWSSQENDEQMELLAIRMSAAMEKPYAVVQGSHFLEYAVEEAAFPWLAKLACKLRHPTVEGTFDGWLYQQGIPSMLIEISKPPLALALVSDLAGYNPPPSELDFHKRNCSLAADHFFKDMIYGI